MADGTLISYKDAKAAGLTRYFTGKPCKHGHVAERHTSSRRCVKCTLLDSIQWKKHNPEKHSANSNRWARRNRGKRNATDFKRKAAKLQRTPPWLTPDHLQQIADIYSECARISEETGVLHHVDHILPLQGETVSGLHVPWNLQILTASENLSKGNRL